MAQTGDSEQDKVVTVDEAQIINHWIFTQQAADWWRASCSGWALQEKVPLLHLVQCCGKWILSASTRPMWEKMIIQVLWFVRFIVQRVALWFHHVTRLSPVSTYPYLWDDQDSLITDLLHESLALRPCRISFYVCGETCQVFVNDNKSVGSFLECRGPSRVGAWVGLGFRY